MAVTFGGAVSANAPAVFATLPVAGTGAMDTGIGITGADHAALPANATGIGAVAITAKFDTDQDPAA
jgi:hypothetical protein